MSTLEQFKMLCIEAIKQTNETETLAFVYGYLIKSMEIDSFSDIENENE